MAKEEAKEKAAAEAEEEIEEKAVEEPQQEAEESKEEEQAEEEAGEEPDQSGDEASDEPGEESVDKAAEEGQPEEEAGEAPDEEEPGKEPDEEVAGEETSGEPDEEKKEAEAKPKPEKKPSKGGGRKIVRVGGKDLDGDMTVRRALPNIPGVGAMFANAISEVCGFADKTVGELNEDQLKKLKEILEDPSKYDIPSWLYNRRFDPEDGKDVHLISAQLDLRRKMDINELKKRKCYRGVRHIIGLPVRGQRTRSSFRRAATVGVSRVKAKPAAKSGGKSGGK